MEDPPPKYDSTEHEGQTSGADNATPTMFNREVRKISITLNLIKSAKRLLKMLRDVDNMKCLYKGQYVQAAIYRYEHYWLPLVAQYQDEMVILPPIDIHWIWIVHMLAPQHYIIDCMTIVNKEIKHRLLSSQACLKARELGRNLWEQIYPNEPWHMTEDRFSSCEYNPKCNKISYCLSSAVERQSSFYYQVSLPHYECKSFLWRAEFRYRQFLALKKTNPHEFLVPCYDMDIMWHAHQVHPEMYKNDTVKLFGHVFPHDDSVNDRSEGSKLQSSDSRTREIWMKSFGTTFRREGAMFRGDPPNKYLHAMPEDIETSVHLVDFHVEILKVKIDGKFQDGPLKVKLVQETHKLSEFTVFHSGSGTSEHNVAEMNLKFAIPQDACNDWVVLKIHSKKRFGKILKFFGKGTFWCMTNFVDMFQADDQSFIKVFKDSETGACVELEMRVQKKLTSSWARLGVFTGEFMPTILNSKLLTSHYGLVTSADTYDEDAFIAEKACHRLFDESTPQKAEIFEVEVVHSRQFLLSSIELLAQCSKQSNVPVALIHTLDYNTLPSLNELRFRRSNQDVAIPCLNVSAGERAMLIKTHGNDYALIIGWWEGLQRGVRGTFSSRGIKGKPGNLMIKIFSPIHAQPYTIALPYDQRKYSFQLDNLHLDLQNGSIKVGKSTTDLVEHVSLGLAITVLHVLCQPRMETSSDDDTHDGPHTYDNIALDLPKRIPTEKLKFLAALGFFCASAPTNAALRKHSERSSKRTGVMMGGSEAYYVPVMCSVAGCGTCGGCGGCGGGVIESLGQNGANGWQVSHSHDGGGYSEDFGGDFSGGDGGASDGALLSSFLASLSAAEGNGGGGDGGDGGGCGGCGGCGG